MSVQEAWGCARGGCAGGTEACKGCGCARRRNVREVRVFWGPLSVQGAGVQDVASVQGLWKCLWRVCVCKGASAEERECASGADCPEEVCKESVQGA